MASSGTFANNNTGVRPVGGTLSLNHCNREISSTSGSWGTPTTMAANTGKWYIEYYVNAGSSGRNVLVVQTNKTKYNQGNYNFPATGDYDITLNSNGSIYNNNDSTATQSGLTALQTGDIMAMALNLDASPKTLQYYRNGTAIGTAENINTNATGHFAFMIMGHNQSTMTINAGQDSSFAGAKSTGTANAADDNGFGNFYYTPPSGFLAMCTGNLPIDENIDPAEGSFPKEHCDHGVYSGTGTAQNITGLNFKPDCVWISQRTTNTTSYNYQFDSTSGVNKYVQLQTAITLTDDANTLTAFNSDGFSIGSDSNTNNSTDNYSFVAWKANGGTTSTNTDGTIASTIQVNQAAGFSIVQYNGGNGTVGHGLGKAPKWIIARPLASGTLHSVPYHPHQGTSQTGGELGYLHFGLNQQFSDYNAIWNDTVPSATVVTVGSAGNVNDSNGIQLMCWAEIEGYSKMGTYKGNANNDGPFVYCGFRPQVLIVKNAGANDDWGMYTQAINDNENDGDSQVHRLDSTNAEQGGTSRAIDFLSNGFKLKTSNATFNSTSGHYIFIAYADVPYKYANPY